MTSKVASILLFILFIVVALSIKTTIKKEKELVSTTLTTTEQKKELSTIAEIASLTIPTQINSTTEKKITEPVNTTTKSSKPTSTTETVTTTKKAVIIDNNYTQNMEVPNVKRDFKSWTNFRQCVNRDSGQWRILTSEDTWTDNNGFRRKNNDYMVAMGSYYTHKLGDRFRIITEDNNDFTVTICDYKSDKHTDEKHQYSVRSGCIVEFYVDNNLIESVKRSGNCSSLPELSGKVTKIYKLN